MKKIFQKVAIHLKLYYMHYLCGVITVGLLLLGIYCFPNCIGRLVESCCDLGNSVAFVFCEAFDIETSIVPTVNNLPDYAYLHTYDWFNIPFRPSAPHISFFPDTWEEFQEKWNLYWECFSKEVYFYGYLLFLINNSHWIVVAVMAGIPLYLLIRSLYRKYYVCEPKTAETDEEKVDTEQPIKESKPLQMWHKFNFTVIAHVKLWFYSFFHFIKERETLWRFWLLLICLYFNIYTMAIEFCAYYVYFAQSFDLINIYRQFYKLLLDLYAVFTFIPLIGWIVIACIVLNALGKRMGYNRLERNERRNRGFINSLGVVTYIYAEMGGNKTSMLTDMALSMEVQLRDDALEIILECDVCFPNFPWLKFERALKQAYLTHEIYDKWSCIRWIRAMRKRFEDNPCKKNIFGYDIERYPMEFDNKMYVEQIWDTLEDYALAYTIYTIESSLIVSNYSIRVDNPLMDLGNFPVWDCDFFHRDSRYIDAFSRHSHILDFDMIRLGNQIVKDNPNRYAFGWGAWIITEADKEFKNTLELQEVKGMVDECNQKNDLTHVLFKMARHACYIRHRNMVRIGADMQRIENITANLRGIGQVALITESDDDSVTLPFFTPYRWLSPFLLWVKDKLDNIYIDDRYLRYDKRLLTSAIEKTRSLIGQWQIQTTGIFGYKTLHIETQSGRMEGNAKKGKYYISFKKGRSKRNGSDCMAGTFESRGAHNLVGLEDMREFADYIATQDELLYENSYTQKELEKYRGGLDILESKDKKKTETLKEFEFLPAFDIASEENSKRKTIYNAK